MRVASGRLLEKEGEKKKVFCKYVHRRLVLPRCLYYCVKCNVLWYDYDYSDHELYAYA